MMPAMAATPRGGGFVRLLRRALTPRTVAGAAGIVAAGFAASRLLGLLRSVAIADAFGTEPELAPTGSRSACPTSSSRCSPG